MESKILLEMQVCVFKWDRNQVGDDEWGNSVSTFETLHGEGK